MPPRKKQTQKSIEAYDHVGQDRLNNQPVGLVDSNNDLNQSQVMWEVHFGSLENDREDSTVPHITFRPQLGVTDSAV